jgi:hypothetical protein
MNRDHCIQAEKMSGSWRHESVLGLKTLPNRMTAFLLMAKQAVIAETHRAERTVKLLTMKNFVPAFAAFDSSIDQLKHQVLIARVLVVGANMVSSR